MYYVQLTKDSCMRHCALSHQQVQKRSLQDQCDLERTFSAGSTSCRPTARRRLRGRSGPYGSSASLAACSSPATSSVNRCAPLSPSLPRSSTLLPSQRHPYISPE